VLAGVKPPTRYRTGLIVSAIFIIVMVGFRRDVGADWDNYLQIFRNIRLHDLGYALGGNTEPAYGLLNWIAARAGWGIWFPNLVCAALFTWGLISFCRLQPNAFLAIAIAVPYFVIGVGMGYTRQSAALGLVMLALVEFTRRRQLRTFVLLAIAPAFHTSALIMIPLFGIVVSRGGVLTAALVLLVGAVMFLQFSGRIQAKLDFYSVRNISGSGAIPRLAMNALPSLIYLAFRVRFASNPAEMRLWTIFALAAVASMLLLLVIESTVILDRMGLYFIPIQIFVLSRIPIAFGDRSRPSLFLLLLVLVYSLLIEIVWLNLGSWGHAWLPYSNYLWDGSIGSDSPRRGRH